MAGVAHADARVHLRRAGRVGPSRRDPLGALEGRLTRARLGAGDFPAAGILLAGRPAGRLSERNGVGAKAGILAFSDGDFAGPLRRAPRADAGLTAALVAEVYPGYRAEPVSGCPLVAAAEPPRDIVYALRVPGFGIMCDQRFHPCKPSEMPEHVLGLAAGRRVALCSVHSVDDSFSYAVWDNGALTRSLSVGLSSPELIVEDIGEPLQFERPFWARRRESLHSHPGRLGFHPLDMGEQALRFLFGFVLEEMTPEPGDLDAAQIAMLGYRVMDPTGAEQGAREAALREFMARAQRSKYRIGPGGALHKTD